MTNGPVEARPAATVVLLRDGPAGLEALLTHRPATMAFAPGVHVFPGGRVDPADGAASLVARSAISPAEAAVGLGGDLEPGPALAAHVAAIRELFEEAGVLLADVGGSGPGSDPARIGAARSALVRGETTLVEVADDLDLRLRTDRLVPLSRWVTPASMPRRFDARFFAATVPSGAEATFEGDEVAAHAWLRPTDALAEMAAGRLAMWLPTSTTLQQLEHARSIEEIRDRLAPTRLGPIQVGEAADGVTRIVMPAGGGVAGQPVSAYLVGRSRFVLVDPGDPSGPALDRALELARGLGGSIAAVALTHVDPDHAAGAQAVAEVARDPGARRARWRRVAAVRDPRAARPRGARRRGHRAPGRCRRRASVVITSRSSTPPAGSSSPAISMACAAPVRSRDRSTGPPWPHPSSASGRRRPRPSGWRVTRPATTGAVAPTYGCPGVDAGRFDTSRRAPRALADG